MILRKKPEAKVTLKKGSGGIFDITVDGTLAYTKSKTKRFPTEREIAAAVGA